MDRRIQWLIGVLLIATTTVTHAEFSSCAAAAPAIAIAPNTPTTTQSVAIGVSWPSTERGINIFATRSGQVIEVTVWTIPAGIQATVTKQCGRIYLGVLPAGAYAINYYLQRDPIDPAPVFQASTSLLVTGAGLLPLYAPVFQGFDYGFPVNVSFANQPVGATSAAVVIDVQNPEPTPRRIFIGQDSCGNAVGGNSGQADCFPPGYFDFPFSTDCPQILMPSASCHVTVAFRPTDAGARLSQITLGSFSADANGNTIGGTLGFTWITLQANGAFLPIPLMDRMALIFLGSSIALIGALFVRYRRVVRL